MLHVFQIFILADKGKRSVKLSEKRTKIHEKKEKEAESLTDFPVKGFNDN